MVEARRTPCYNCPFRKDEAAVPLSEGRLDGIISTLYDNDAETFYCHKTTTGEHVTQADGKERYVPAGYEKECMGAIAYMQKRYHRISVNARINLIAEKITIKHVRSAMDVVIDRAEDAKTCE